MINARIKNPPRPGSQFVPFKDKQENIPKYLQIASNHAIFADHNNDYFKLAAIIVKKNNILSKGYCTTRKTHPIQAKLNPLVKGIHAEISAIINAKCDVSGSHMFIARRRKDNTLGNSKPCKFCMSLLIEAEISTITYVNGGYVTTEILPKK